MNMVELLTRDGFKVVRHAKGELCCACPLCGGKDRFIIYEDTDMYWCRGCERSGGTYKYLTEFKGMSPRDAMQTLGIDSNSFVNKDYQKREKQVWTPKTDIIPCEQWQLKARKFVESSFLTLWNDDKYKPVREYITSRGLTERKARAFELGYNPDTKYEQRKLWGLQNVTSENGASSTLWIPRGIVIHDYRKGNFIKVRIRRPDKDVEELKRKNPEKQFSKYISLPTGCESVSASMQLINDNNRKRLIIVESDFDAFLINQDAGDLIGVISLGSACYKPDRDTDLLLSNAEIILLSLDFDEAGIRAMKDFFLQRYPHSIPMFSTEEKDIGDDCRKQGISVREWIVTGLAYWKEVKGKA